MGSVEEEVPEVALSSLPACSAAYSTEQPAASAELPALEGLWVHEKALTQLCQRVRCFQQKIVLNLTNILLEIVINRWKSAQTPLLI